MTTLTTIRPRAADAEAGTESPARFRLDPTVTARRFFAAADPTRVRILRLLAGGERCVCELVEALDAAQPRLSFHLRTLRDAGLVHDRRRGRWIYYSLNTDVLDAMSACVTDWSESARLAGDPVCGCGGSTEGCC